jgi:GNAT superfamily N-acetyltransferase
MDLSDLAARWHRGWAISRGLPAGEDLGDALRASGLQRGRDVEYLALHADDDPPSLRRLARRVLAESGVTWLTVPTTAPDEVAAALEAAGLTLLKRTERLMATDLRTHPHHAPPPHYRLQRHTRDGAVTISLHDTRDGAVTVSPHDSPSGGDGGGDGDSGSTDSGHGGNSGGNTDGDGAGDLAASGTMGIYGLDATADRILTAPAHRRHGLGSAVMSALAETAVDAGARHGLLVASEAGQRLYTALGWHAAAHVLIAAPPGPSYPVVAAGP